MAGPGDEIAAAESRSRDDLRASHADREQVIGTLKTAFVQGRLTGDELDARVGQVYASRTYAELDAVTADIPTDSASAASAAAASPPAGPARTPAVAGPTRSPARTLGIATRRAAMLMLAAVALGEGGFLFPDTRDNFGGFMVFMAFILAMASLGFFGYGIVDAVEARRSLRQAPPRPGPGGRGLESGRPVRKPVPPGPRDDQTRADLRAHISRRIDRRLPSQVPGWAIGPGEP